jgi:DNA-directed RNA polymerase subunit RPC12/RpoP
VARSGFTKRKYVCVLCGDEFTALGGGMAVADPVCMHCGLKWPAEKLRRRIQERRKNRR